MSQCEIVIDEKITLCCSDFEKTLFAYTKRILEVCSNTAQCPINGPGHQTHISHLIFEDKKAEDVIVTC